MHRSLIQGESIRVTGTVQGVGFRPSVWRLANECELSGEVWNDAEGVMIHVWGSQQSRDNFVARLRQEKISLAHIEAMIRRPLPNASLPPQAFHIAASQPGQTQTNLPADAATCAHCCAEISDPENRRYRYAFTNCTHCGPRLSIVNSIPYDRVNTSMSEFTMCARCQSEYDDPADRRFHAQPNACPECGPKLWLENIDGSELCAENGSDVIALAVRLLQSGNIVAIKGIGGIQLACDATNDHAVKRLRQRKHRYAKPFALMARDIAMIMNYAQVSADEAAALRSCAAPIVILHSTHHALADSVAPGQQTLGFMLPATPLHHLLMQAMAGPIVLTSGNRSDEPQLTQNRHAHQRLDNIVDYYLLHNREIVNRLDDSVLRFIDSKPRLMRRARGYAPHPILVHNDFSRLSKNILAMGGELKNTFCLLNARQAILSPHIGDLKNTLTYQDYHHHLQLFLQLYDHQLEWIAVDKHPDYRSTKTGLEWAQSNNVPVLEVQHHHAHVAACMMEHNLGINTENVLGIVMDGLGFGDDGTFWGGEFLLCNYEHYQRVAHFEPVALLGGAQAMLEPWRNTWAYMHKTFSWQTVQKEYAHLDIVRFLQTKPGNTLQHMLRSGLNSPLSSSCGRLFDAVAGALGICCQRVAYEGQAAVELEALATEEFQRQSDNAYAFTFNQQATNMLQWQPLWRQLLIDLHNGVTAAVIAARFHHAVIQAISQVAITLCHQHTVQTVVLSGGVFQNHLLLQAISDHLKKSGLSVLSPGKVPANDGGLALGQAAVAAAQIIQQRI